MKDYIIKDEWSIIEENFDASLNRISESLFSIGNGRMGQRANFEENYTGDTLQGSYVAGVYYPDKTRVGWWKNGYPEYFAKVLNSANWIGISIAIDGESVDINQGEVLSFRRELNMKAGYLRRTFVLRLPSDKEIAVEAVRLCSIVDDEAGAIRYSVRAINFSGQIRITPYIDGDIKNEDANYDEKFWDEVAKGFTPGGASLTLKTKKTDFWVTTAMQYQIWVDGVETAISSERDVEREKYVGKTFELELIQGSSVQVEKYAVNLSSENHPKEELQKNAAKTLHQVVNKGFDRMMAEQAAAWEAKWAESDIQIEGDVSAQQAIRFNIFQLFQTYTGKDSRLNIGPKGFTGEKYGGSTYWDTEAYCLAFYLATTPQYVARNLLIYRYKHLGKAIENAKKLGFGEGAALYPMVTMNGEECHNEWEITFEEIHRNGAIAFAIYNYIRYTGDDSYLSEYGLEILIAIARFWSQRVNWSADKQQYVILGVTGPNEYENNVNNNWYTNTMAVWCLRYAIDTLDQVERTQASRYREIVAKTEFRLEEIDRWKDIIQYMYYPVDTERGVFLQQDDFLDKELIPTSRLPDAVCPLNQHWSWDRVLRSCYIKQADVLQGVYLFEDRYDLDTIRRNFDFYEPLTVHESSLSPCVHAILAAKLGDRQRAYEFYLRTARLDLDDYNNDTEDGLHITSMAGTWMSVVEGFAGMRVRDGHLHFAPMLPEKWQSFSFKIGFRGITLTMVVGKQQVCLRSEQPITVYVNGVAHVVAGERQIFF